MEDICRTCGKPVAAPGGICSAIHNYADFTIQLGQAPAELTEYVNKIESSVVSNIAPPGWIWRCGACGKKTRDRYGEAGGWDESCMLNSTLVKEPNPNARRGSES